MRTKGEWRNLYKPKKTRCPVSETIEANARLRSDATDLLEVCKAFIKCLGPEGYYPVAGEPNTRAMREAIAKAEK